MNSLTDTIRNWEQEQITTKQAIGQLLTLIAKLERRLGQLETQISRKERSNRPAANHQRANKRD